MTGENLKAHFGDRSAEESFTGLPQTDFALDSSLETLPRELIQNTYDAKIDGEKPEIIFALEKIQGDELDEFLEAIDWPTLKPRLESVAGDDEKLGIRGTLDQIDGGELLLLRVEDRNTEGLAGPEDERGTNYASLVKDFADSTKKQGGGIHGVGASVLWAFSGLKLVLFNSNLQESGKSRFIGRLDLPDFSHNGEDYKGGGWIGVEDDDFDRPISKWDISDELAETLHVNRPDDFGTTELVVGFREPTRQTRSTEELVEVLYEAIARYYWPLIVDAGIDVMVQGPGDPEPKKIEPESVPRVAPYVEAYENWQSPSQDFGEPGTVGVEKLEFDVPASESRGETTGELTLVARLVSEEDLEKYRNKVAMLRGARHVVKYRKYGTEARTTGREFHGLLLAGGAKHPIETDSEDWPTEDGVIEAFFRDAEPRSHNSWEIGTQKLANTYQHENPTRRIVSFLQTDVKTALQRMLGNAEVEDDERIDSLGSEFPFFDSDHGGGEQRETTRQGGGDSDFHVEDIESWFDDAYHYEGSFTLDSNPDQSWSVEVSIKEVDGSNKTIDQVDIQNVKSPQATSEICDDGIATLEFPKDTTDVDFKLHSSTIGGDILSGRTRLQIDYDLPGGEQ